MKKNKHSSIFTLKSYVYTRILPMLRAKPSTQINNFAKMAIVCDQMTWKNICQDHNVVALTPRTWKDVLPVSRNNNQIKLFFCEAAWSGVPDSCWRGQIYKDRRVFYENRRSLLDVLRRCKTIGIPSVFWAKEDPEYFEDDTYDFTDTAIKFDYILTTAQECISKYNAMGHNNVHLWPFGFSPKIFYPPGDRDVKRENVAVFAGSWLVEHPKRCRDMADIFDMVLDANIVLRIYDRHCIAGKSAKPFPDKYKPFVLDSVPYEELGEIYRNAEYAINVNTVRDSSTMFARRVYEAMACGCIVITNESVGLRQQFNQNMWYLGESFDITAAEKIRRQNIQTVFTFHTGEQRMEQLYALTGVESN